jgi:CheY-like chemotaxis protein
MSHELRTPLNSILGFSQLLEMGDPSPQDRESITHIMKAGKHLLGLINEVLDIAREEAGKLALSLEAVPVCETIEEAIALVQPLAAQSNISLTHEKISGAVRHAMADRQRLKQVILNILSNAVKYNHEGGNVAVSSDTDLAGKLTIRIVDTGKGIAPDLLPRLFAPFDRLGADTSDIDGTGLGLTLSKSFVEAMHGEIEVTSKIGVGSEFRVILPVAEDPMNTVRANGDDPASISTFDGATRRTVLYIEDNAANLKLVQSILERRPSVRLVSATHGGLGIEMARVHQPDLALLDLNLPDIPGQEVLRKLQDDPETRNIPVVMISADATEGQARRLLEHGARAYLTKPIEVKQFLDTVDDVLLAA